jgi:SAM-dependent methyltransferase
MDDDHDRYMVREPWSSIDEIVTSTAGAGTLRLDLGCGYSKPDGYIGLDNLGDAAFQVVDERHGPDILMDLDNDRLPFANDSCDEVRSSHFLEHSSLDHVLAESYRVLKRGGLFVFMVPYANSAEGMYPGHVQFLTEKWFYENRYFQQHFEILNERYDPSSDWLELPRVVRRIIPFDFARKHLFNACWQMTMTSRVRK